MFVHLVSFLEFYVICKITQILAKFDFCFWLYVLAKLKVVSRMILWQLRLLLTLSHLQKTMRWEWEKCYRTFVTDKLCAHFGANHDKLERFDRAHLLLQLQQCSNFSWLVDTKMHSQDVYLYPSESTFHQGSLEANWTAKIVDVILIFCL